MHVATKKIKAKRRRVGKLIGHNGQSRKLIEEEPLRSELFSVEQLEHHAKALASWHELDVRSGPDHILPRLSENEDVLADTYQLITAAMERRRSISPAGEWLIDNYYLIEEQIRTTRRHLPSEYSRELPRLRKGPSAGFPRVYDIALELISHVDGRVDMLSLSSFVASYQTINVLKLGELWAIPIMLRMALIENLRRVASRIASARRDRDRADAWADQLLAVAEKEPGHVVLVLADMVRDNPPLTSAFVAGFVRRLQGQLPNMAFPVSWLEQRLIQQGQNIEELIQQENHNQAADQVSIGNSIGSLRFLSATEWRDFVETMSAVEQTLRTDPADIYSDMDFETRNSYRDSVERIAKRCPHSEDEVARKAVQLARSRAAHNADEKRIGHVGYYLVDKGRPLLEQAVAVRLPLASILTRQVKKLPLVFYAGAITAMTVCIVAWVMMCLRNVATRGVFLLPVVFCASQLSVTVINWICSLLIAPRRLPRMDYSEGIPPECRTTVVVPAMLSDPQCVEELLETIEIHFLANRDDHLHFALLSDFPDAPKETMPDDEKLLLLARQGIEYLNEQYPLEDGDRFYLFHRPRRWNQQQDCWMSWERKRGKLTEFNAYLRGLARDRFSLIVGATEILRRVRYVITLDADTQLTLGAARQLVGTMAHPLNHARFDPRLSRVVEGYGILQPRVGVSLPSAGRSLFAKLFASDTTGIDPYTRATSDVYQDVFKEGSYIGKGIYDVDAFEKAIDNHFPEDRILSHDLLEGAYARSGLVSDVVLFEGFPSRYAADISRRHRWIRGDWQISSWLGRHIPAADGRRIPNRISALSHWKIFDNLRRSLVPIFMLVLILLGWFVPGAAAVVTLFVVAVIAFPAILSSILDLIRKPLGLPLRLHLRFSSRFAGRQFLQAGLTLIFLPHEAFFCLDAVVRTLVREWITHKKLLEWQTARDCENKTRIDWAGPMLGMWVAPVGAFICACTLFVARQPAFLIAIPFLLAWSAAPVIVIWLSRPLVPRPPKLKPEDYVFLRTVARRTWRYFEVFVTQADHYLPPDNYQEQPVTALARRTSPTNIGLSALADLAAYDFGYIPANQLINRTSQVVGSLERMERYRGHFYNWYDTATLRPFPSLYISTVDSGNLAGDLLTLAPGLLDLVDHPILPRQTFNGILDTVRVLLDEITRPQKSGHRPSELPRDIVARIERLGDGIPEAPKTLNAAKAFLQHLTGVAAEIVANLSSHPDEEIKWWLRAFERQCRHFLDDLVALAPWVNLAPSSEQMWRRGSAEQIHRFATLRDLMRHLDEIPTLHEVAQLRTSVLPTLDKILAEMHAEKSSAALEIEWFTQLREAMLSAAEVAAHRIKTLEQLAARCRELADFDYEFLYDRSRRLMVIGYNAASHRLDTSFYDLLASEARLGSFIAIAQGKIPQEHWFNLGRLLTTCDSETALISWSGSMFEYLMPILIMPNYPSTLLDRTYHAVVKNQMNYCGKHGIPWGISESCFNTTDIHLNYQYQAFGIPGLGFKRGLADDLVIAPYASMLALMVMPEESCANLRRMADDKLVGAYGFYEAVDYTPSRLPRGKNHAIIRSFMAHHQGMGLLALNAFLLDWPMQRRFESDPLIKATQTLLQERVPKVAVIYPHTDEHVGEVRTPPELESVLRVYTSPHTVSPEVHLLSNGRCHVMVTAAGGGYMRWRDLAVTRWQEDCTQDSWGAFCYLRDIESDEFWSVAYQPTLIRPRTYEAMFSQARAEFRRRDGDIDTHTEISVSSEDDIELRRVSITNRGSEPRKIEITSYAEPVLTTAPADAVHPAFSKLFVQTEIIPSRQAILCTRRPRSTAEAASWMFHLMTLEAAEVTEPTFETDRRRFIGRGGHLADPAAMHIPKLSNTEGGVLDPIVAIRRTVLIQPDETVQLNIVTGIAETRELAMSMMDKYHDRRIAERVFELAWTHSQVILRQLDASEGDAQLFGRLAGSILYANSLRRAPASLIARNRRGQSGLWGHGVSGDNPLVLLRIGDTEKIDLVKQLVQAHAYWRNKGLTVDLVILNEDLSGYRQQLHDLIMGLIAASTEAQSIDRPGGIFVRRAEHVPEEDKVLMQTVARIIITDTGGTLREQVERRARAEVYAPKFMPMHSTESERPVRVELPRRDLDFFNGYGGFTRDGREYIITLKDKRATPAPWVNVIANPEFGTVVTESGSAYTWFENAHEYRLTPWSNDPVRDWTGEAFYIRDEESGNFWSPSPLPARGFMPYNVRHGFGYSVFEYTENGIFSEMWTYVAIDAPVKFVVLKLKNSSGHSRRLSIFGYIEWVLGEQRPKNAMHVVTEIDPQTGGLLARNPYNHEFNDRVAFFSVSESQHTFTGNRTEFIGRNGSKARPAAMGRTKLSNRVGAGLDPCAAIHTVIDLPNGHEREIVFVLGAARDANQAGDLIGRFRQPHEARRALENVWSHWGRTLGAVHFETPDTSLDFMLNGWLLYQVISSRLWARSGFYQSGGAYGFRDQLQDVGALIHAAPHLMREHLLRAAAQQFHEGDVQHWWHPPIGRGVRTHISDDYLWLPYIACRYVTCVGDTGVLDEKIPFLEGRPVNPEEESYYDLPMRSDELGTLYEHCVRAIRNGLKFGEHGLPLMGCGDWNDGMNLVGAGGKGESVWLAFFLYDVLTRFAELARSRGDTEFADQCVEHAGKLRQNVEQHGWDGTWYRRAYFDNGEPLGSASNPECQIDSIAQSWAVLSHAGDKTQAQVAMAAVERRLVMKDAKLIRLFDPPFDQSPLQPGYIKGYLPGVRENGGQYTHAAIWSIMALAELGESGRAWDLLSCVNPIHHGSIAHQIETYQIEPYVVPADIYTHPQHVGRGGWSWYTGSASWLYRLLTESLFGLRLQVDRLYFHPLLPPAWKTVKIHYRYRETVYHISLNNLGGNTVSRVLLDGTEQSEIFLPLLDDRVEHQVEIELS